MPDTYERLDRKNARRRKDVQPISQAERPDLPPLGQLVTDDDGDRVQCHVCGAFWRSLAIHVRHGHGLSPAAYRERYDLNRTASLVSPATAARMAATQRAHLAAIRPETPGFARLSRAEIGAITSQPRRLQMRVKKSRDATAQPKAPRVRSRPAKQPADWLGPARAAKAALHADPARHAAFRAAVRRGRSRLTDAERDEIRALKGQATYQQVIDRYHCGTRTIARLWRE